MNTWELWSCNLRKLVWISSWICSLMNWSSTSYTSRVTKSSAIPIGVQKTSVVLRSPTSKVQTLVFFYGEKEAVVSLKYSPMQRLGLTRINGLYLLYQLVSFSLWARKNSRDIKMDCTCKKNLLKNYLAILHTLMNMLCVSSMWTCLSTGSVILQEFVRVTLSHVLVCGTRDGRCGAMLGRNSCMISKSRWSSNSTRKWTPAADRYCKTLRNSWISPN